MMTNSVLVPYNFGSSVLLQMRAPVLSTEKMIQRERQEPDRTVSVTRKLRA